MTRFLSGFSWVLRVVLICAAQLLAVAAFAYVTVPWPHPEADLPPVKGPAESGEKIHRLGGDDVLVPAEVARKMGLRTAPAALTRPVQLPPFQGSLALDGNGLARTRSRFAGEVIEVGSTTDPVQPAGSASYPAPPPNTSSPRPLRVGDRIKKGDLLAVVWSKDLGEKKSELVDGISKLRSDRMMLGRARELYQEGAGPERTVRDAERALESDRVAVERAERTLRAWGLSADEVASVRAEADTLTQPDAKRSDPARWARVEVRSPRDGVILEKNLAAGDIVDTTTDLFKVGDLSHLTVWTHVYEEDLPLLQALPRPVRWTVRVPSRPGVSFPGTMEQVGEVIDPNQHTALVSGRIENPDGTLKVGQFVTVTVELPPPGGEVELPSDAVVEDGRESVVFVAADQEGRFTRRTVRVVRRLRDAISVRAEAGGIRPGQQVVTAGALLLREAVDGLPRPGGEAVAALERLKDGPDRTR